jgi:DNA-binding CsgD family transcriptional regulator
LHAEIETVAAMMLTPRETEIARLVGSGMTNTQIAKRLGMSFHTVKTHLHSAYAKTGAQTRAALAAWMVATDMCGTDYESGPSQCPHGKPYGECNACDVAGDFAYDAAREARVFK